MSRTIRGGHDDHTDRRDKLTSSAAEFAIAGTDTASLSAIAFALLAIETQMARFNVTVEEFLRMAKEESL